MHAHMRCCHKQRTTQLFSQPSTAGMSKQASLHSFSSAPPPSTWVVCLALLLYFPGIRHVQPHIFWGAYPCREFLSLSGSSELGGGWGSCVQPSRAWCLHWQAGFTTWYTTEFAWGAGLATQYCARPCLGLAPPALPPGHMCLKVLLCCAGNDRGFCWRERSWRREAGPTGGRD